MSDQPSISSGSAGGEGVLQPQTAVGSFEVPAEIKVQRVTAAEAKTLIGEMLTFFVKNWRPYLVFSVGYFIVNLVLTYIPVGWLLQAFFYPIFYVGVLLTIRKLRAGQGIVLRDFFSALQGERAIDLFILGFVQIFSLGVALVFSFSTVLFYLFLSRGADLFESLPFLSQLANMVKSEKNPSIIADVFEKSGISDFLANPMAVLQIYDLIFFGFFIFAFLLVVFIIIAAFIFSPFLVYDFGASLKVALKNSVKACFTNLGAWLILTIVYFIFYLVAILTFGLGFALLPILTFLTLALFYERAFLIKK